MAELKTQENDADVAAFLSGVAHARRREDAKAVCAMMERLSGQPPRMWGGSIIGFGAYEYQQKNGQAGRWPIVGLSPRKANLTVYIMPGFDAFADDLAALGPHKTSVSCLYLTDLRKVDMAVLERIVARSIEIMRARYPGAS